MSMLFIFQNKLVERIIEEICCITNKGKKAKDKREK